MTQLLSYRMWFILLALFVPFVLLYNLTLGPGDVSLGQALALLGCKLEWNECPTGVTNDLVWLIRLPRALLALLLGAALGSAGTLTQGLFRNPLASPNMLGLSSGAATAVIFGFTFGLDDSALWVTPFLAAFGALVVFGMLYVLTAGSHNIMRILLSGIAISTIMSALISLMLSLNLRDYEASSKTFQWLLGSLESRSWSHLGWGLIPVSAGLAFCFLLGRYLDVLHLGEDSAASLGVNLRQTYVKTILVVSLLIGAATALSGIIGFVGLLVPHLGRLIVGNNHTRLIPFAALLGAVFLLVVDIASRIILEVYLAPGVITSILGAPLFLWLIRRVYRVRSL